MEILGYTIEASAFFPVLGTCVFVPSAYIVKKALGDIETLKNTSVKIDDLQAVSQEVESLIGNLKEINSKLEDKFATQERVRIVEKDLRHLDATLEASISALRADIMAQLSFITRLIEK